MSALAQTDQESIIHRQRMRISIWQRALKRGVDLVGATVLLLLSLPVLCVLALRIKLHDNGPVLFRRRVVGPHGEFDAFKLRTMRVDADDILRRNDTLRRQYEVNFKLEKDPRVTSVGLLLRRTGLDELPQLWNVLKGEMSLVGPRMITQPSSRNTGAPAGSFLPSGRALPGFGRYNAVLKRATIAVSVWICFTWRIGRFCST